MFHRIFFEPIDDSDLFFEDEHPGLLYRNFDFFSVRKQGSDFFEEATAELWNKIAGDVNWDWKRIYLWADGGMENGGNLVALSELQKSISELAIELKENSYPYLQANFYPPYHGHNVCDAHFGQIKIATRKAMANLNHPAPPAIETALSAAAARPRTTVFHLPDSRPKKAAKTKAFSVDLRREDPAPLTKPSLALKKLKCWFFDPCSTCPFLGYPFSQDAGKQEPIRASIDSPEVGVSLKLPENHLGDNPPWKPNYGPLPT